MEFDRVVFNEEPGAVYGPGAAPMPGASRGWVLARGGGCTLHASASQQPVPAHGAGPCPWGAGRTHATHMRRGATHAPPPRAAQCGPTLATT